MDASGIKTTLEDLLDTALIHFSYADYLRDFQMYFYHSTYDSNVIPHWIDKVTFRNCVIADISTNLPPKTWEGSLDDNLIGDLEDVEQPIAGWVWATRFSDMYPGASLVERSADAAKWSKALGIPFYEALFEANPMRIRLIFSDIMSERAVPGESPFTVETPPGN